MSKKKDMYIDYKRSFKRRGRRRNKLLQTILLSLLITGVMVGVGYSIWIRINTNNQISNEQDKAKENLTEGQQGAEQLLTEEDQPNNELPQPSVTLEVTPTPLPTMPPATEEAIEVMESRIPVKVKGIYVTSAIAGSSGLLDELILWPIQRRLMQW